MERLPELKTNLPTHKDWGMMKEQGALLVKTGFLPASIKTPEQAIAIMLKGRELDIGPMHAFSSISIIQGKPAVSPELMLNLIFRAFPKTKLTYKTLNDNECTIEVTRPGQDPSTFSFTMSDAKRAGLATKDNWKKYPRAMLRSRCIAEMARSIFPDAISGCSYTLEELGADTNETHEVIPAKPASNRTTLPKPLTLEERIEKMIGAFEEIRITEDVLEGALGCPIDEITAEELSKLKNIYLDIKRDPAKKLDYFPEHKPESAQDV